MSRVAGWRGCLAWSGEKLPRFLQWPLPWACRQRVRFKKDTLLCTEQVLGALLPGKPLIAFSLSSLFTELFKRSLFKTRIVFN